MKEKARDLRMIFFVRTDLEMSLGKTAAQVGHAVGNLIMDRMINALSNLEVDDPFHDTFLEWYTGHSVKITLAVDNEEDLLEFYKLGKRLGFPASLVQDKGFTELEGDNYTVVGWGPVHKLDHHDYTSHLKLL